MSCTEGRSIVIVKLLNDDVLQLPSKRLKNISLLWPFIGRTKKSVYNVPFTTETTNCGGIDECPTTGTRQSGLNFAEC